jgi:hypothetical protein
VTPSRLACRFSIRGRNATAASVKINASPRKRAPPFRQLVALPESLEHITLCAICAKRAPPFRQPLALPESQTSPHQLQGFRSVYSRALTAHSRTTSQSRRAGLATPTLFPTAEVFISSRAFFRAPRRRAIRLRLPKQN